MVNPLVLIANEPRAYRDTLTLALKMLRPHANVLAVEPDDLDAEITLRHPDVAICSRLSPTVESRVPTWVLLYPDGANMVVVSLDGEQSTTGELALETLADAIIPA